MIEIIVALGALVAGYLIGRNHINDCARKTQLENYTLRDALREANKELYRHRRLIASLRDGDDHTTNAVMAAMEKK